jgi:hypothetical protein
MASPTPLKTIHLLFPIANLKRSAFGKNSEARIKLVIATTRLKIMNRKGLELGATFLEASTNIALPIAARRANKKEVVNKFFKMRIVIFGLISVIH